MYISDTGSRGYWVIRPTEKEKFFFSAEGEVQCQRRANYAIVLTGVSVFVSLAILLQTNNRFVGLFAAILILSCMFAIAYGETPARKYRKLSKLVARGRVIQIYWNYVHLQGDVGWALTRLLFSGQRSVSDRYQEMLLKSLDPKPLDDFLLTGDNLECLHRIANLKYSESKAVLIAALEQDPHMQIVLRNLELQLAEYQQVDRLEQEANKKKLADEATTEAASVRSFLSSSVRS